jgi:hypothetical protein
MRSGELRGQGFFHSRRKAAPAGLCDRPPSSSNKKMLFYVVDWLPPDFGAVGQHGLIFARDYAAQGRDVCLIGLTSGAGGTCREVAEQAGVLEIKRLPAKRYNKSGLVS